MLFPFVVLNVLLNAVAFLLAVLAATSANESQSGVSPLLAYLGAGLFLVIGAVGWVWLGFRMGEAA